MFEVSCRGEGPNWNRTNLSPQGSERVPFNLPQGEYTYTFTCDFNPKCLAPQICPEMPVRSLSDSVKVISRIQTPPPTTQLPHLEVFGMEFYRYPYPETPENKISTSSLANYLGQAMKIIMNLI